MLGGSIVKRRPSHLENSWRGKGRKGYALNDYRCIEQLMHENDSCGVDARSHNAETITMNVTMINPRSTLFVC